MGSDTASGSLAITGVSLPHAACCNHLITSSDLPSIAVGVAAATSVYTGDGGGSCIGGSGSAVLAVFSSEMFLLITVADGGDGVWREGECVRMGGGRGRVERRVEVVSGNSSGSSSQGSNSRHQSCAGSPDSG